jgi:hypothetical protein
MDIPTVTESIKYIYLETGTLSVVVINLFLYREQEYEDDSPHNFVAFGERYSD